MVPREAAQKPVQGITDATGFYEIETLAKPGEYAVGITEIGVGVRRVPPKYASGSTSGLTVSIRPAGDNHLAFDLSD